MKKQLSLIIVTLMLVGGLSGFDYVLKTLDMARLTLLSLNTYAPVNQGSSLIFVVRRDGNTYHAESQTTSTSFSGDLKFVVESAADELRSAGGGEIAFEAGDFDIGSEHFELNDLLDVVFSGQGIDITILRNNTNASTDTEPFDFRRSDRITIRDMTISAGGSFRNTSDAIDFDGGDDSLVERVKIISARGRGIIFDGKDSVASNGGTADGNIVRDCIIMDVPRDGIQLLASNDNLIENCTITNVGGDGIRVTKSSATADQPHKQSNNNTISNNTITNSGGDGIKVNSGDDNIVINNMVFNSSDDLPSQDGISVESSSSIDCDDNIIDSNTATDNQTPKTQRYGLNINSPICDRTIVRGNDFAGNLVADINDNGTNTMFGPPDTEAPTAPTGLTATSIMADQVDLSWNAATDNVGVTSYDIFRDGSQIDSVNGNTTTYQDTTVSPETSYQYFVRARDAAGNISPNSNTINVTTPAPPPMVIFNPTDDATIRPNRGNLGAEPVLEVDASSVKDSLLRFNVTGVGSANVLNVTLRLFVTDSSSNGGDFVRVTNTNWSENTVTWENAPPGDGGTLGSLGSAVSGTWAELDVTSLVTGDGPVSVRISSPSSNGVDYASKEHSNGNAPELIVTIDSEPEPDTEPPTAPGNLTATNVQATQVTLNWDASTDNVGVVGYDIFRNGSLLTSIGTATTHQDNTVSPSTNYQYFVRARDAAGNISSDSNTVNVTTPASSPITTFTPTDDASIRASRPTQNFGSNSELEVDASSEKNTLLRFDVTGLGGAVTSATLRLFVIDSSSQGGNFFAMTNTSWSENTVTWNNAPPGDGGSLGSLGSVSSGNWVELDVTPLVTGNGPVAIRVSSTSSNGADYSAKEHSNGNAPELVVVTQGTTQ